MRRRQSRFLGVLFRVFLGRLGGHFHGLGERRRFGGNAARSRAMGQHLNRAPFRDLREAGRGAARLGVHIERLEHGGGAL